MATEEFAALTPRRRAARVEELTNCMTNLDTLRTVANETVSVALNTRLDEQQNPTPAVVATDNVTRPVGEAIGAVIKHKTGTK